MLALSILSTVLFSGIALAENIINFDSEFKPINFRYPVVNLDVKTNKQNYLRGENVEITIENIGDKTVYFYGPAYHWIIEQYKEREWSRVYPCGVEICIFLKTQLEPGEKETGIWNQKICRTEPFDNNVRAPSGYYRVVVTYWMNEYSNANEPSFTKYAYFAIDNIYTINIESIERPPIISKRIETPVAIESSINSIKSFSMDEVELEKPKTVSLDEILDVTFTKDDAVLKAEEQAKLESIKTVKLNEQEMTYKVTGVKSSKLLWCIPVNIDVAVYIDATTGNVQKIEMPWWSFLAS